MLLLGLCAPAVPAPSTIPAPNWFWLVAPCTVKPSIVTSLAVRLKEVEPLLPVTTDSVGGDCVTGDERSALALAAPPSAPNLAVEFVVMVVGALGVRASTPA